VSLGVVLLLRRRLNSERVGVAESREVYKETDLFIFLLSSVGLLQYLYQT